MGGAQEGSARSQQFTLDGPLCGQVPCVRRRLVDRGNLLSLGEATQVIARAVEPSMERKEKRHAEECEQTKTQHAGEREQMKTRFLVVKDRLLDIRLRDLTAYWVVQCFLVWSNSAKAQMMLREM